MNNVLGTVVKTSKDMAGVLIKRNGMCSENCDNCNICGKSETVLYVKNILNAKKGDKIELLVNSKDGFFAALMAYGVPLLILVVSMLFIYFIFPKKEVLLLIPFLLVALWYFLLFILNKKGKFSSYSANMVKIIENEV